MVDRSVPFFDLFMIYDDLSNVTEVPLPEGYAFRFFNGSEEDIKYWVDIEASSGDVKSVEEAYEGFETYYRPYINTLLSRCIFILNSNNEPIGTATGFFLVDHQPGLPKISENPESIPQSVTGHLHWVAIKEEYKRKGLAKPMITKAMKIMAQHNHNAAFLHTQTPSWLACKIYLDLGWKPFRFVQSEDDFKRSWEIVREKIEEIRDK